MTLITLHEARNETWEWFVQLNEICKEMNVPKILRDDVPRDLKTKKAIQDFLKKLVKKNSGGLENLQKADGQYRELCNKISTLEAQLMKIKSTNKKV
jgi:hypothetical protein